MKVRLIHTGHEHYYNPRCRQIVSSLVSFSNMELVRYPVGNDELVHTVNPMHLVLPAPKQTRSLREDRASSHKGRCIGFLKGREREISSKYKIEGSRSQEM